MSFFVWMTFLDFWGNSQKDQNTGSSHFTPSLIFGLWTKHSRKTSWAFFFFLTFYGQNNKSNHREKKSTDQSQTVLKQNLLQIYRQILESEDAYSHEWSHVAHIASG